ncbi:hypothetical protein ABZR62_06240, partial [Pseudomonas aeruginosa]
SLNQTEKIDHELQASACRIESLSEQWLTFQMNEFSPYLGMTPLWRQKLRRQEAKGRKQYNFILSDKAIKRLDRFSKNLEPSRARILEILLQMEDEKDLYLKEQIRVLRGIEL